MGSHLETFVLKAKDNVQSRTITDFSDLPSSSMSNPFSNNENRKKKKQLQQVPFLPSLNNTNIGASSSKIDVDCKLLLQKSCIRVLNDRAELVEFTQSFKSRFGYDSDHKAAWYNELQELLEAMQFLVQIESIKELDNTTVTGIITTTSGMMMLNPPTLVELNSDSVVNATNLRCS